MVTPTAEESVLRNQRIRNVTLWGFVINLALTGIKLVVGICGGSKSLVADAVHSLSDAASDIGLLIGLRLWSKPGDAEHPYGHGKFENVTGLVISAMLAITAAWIIWDALLIAHKEVETPPGVATFWVAILSIIVKEWMYRWTKRVGERTRSETVIANAWHHRSDALSSIVAAFSIGISRLWEGFGFVDDIGAVVVGVILLQAAWKIAFPAFGKLMDMAPPPVLRKAIQDAAGAVPGVLSAHALRMRYVGENIFVDMHIEVSPEISVRAGHDISSSVSHSLCKSFEEIADVIVHVEPYQNNDA